MSAEAAPKTDVTEPTGIQDDVKVEAQLEALVGQLGGSLTVDEKALMSKVLFPEGDIQEVVVLGHTLTLHPLPLKHSRLINDCLAELSKQAGEALKDTKKTMDFNEMCISNLKNVLKIIASKYQNGPDVKAWTEISAAVDAEEISVTEMQSIAVQQAQKNGTNDFLLGGLRSLIRLMKAFEILHIKLLTSSFTQQ